jgi:hypothetical protein
VATGAGARGRQGREPCGSSSATTWRRQAARILGNPWLVQNDAAVAWKTALWYWNTQTGPGTMTGHNAMVTGAGFGHTIRSINGSLECDGGNPAQVQSRVDAYRRFVRILGTSTGGDLYC